LGSCRRERRSVGGLLQRATFDEHVPNVDHQGGHGKQDGQDEGKEDQDLASVALQHRATARRERRCGLGHSRVDLHRILIERPLSHLESIKQPIV
jgi:hypothetical protein